MSYPKDQIEFLQAVQDMRQAQRDYFRQPTDYRLRVSKAKERGVDELLLPFVQAGAIVTKPEAEKVKMPELFQ